MKQLIVARRGRIKMVLPMRRTEIRADGTIWINGMPLLGLIDRKIKKEIVKLVTSRKHGRINPEWLTRLGDNPNGLWAGTREEWEHHPDKIKADKEDRDGSKNNGSKKNCFCVGCKR